MFFEGKDTAELIRLADECDMLSDKCENLYLNLKREREKQEDFKLFLRTTGVCAGMLLQAIVMLAYFVMLWGTSIFRNIATADEIPAEPFLGFIYLSENEFIAIFQITLPLAIFAIIIGIISVIFHKQTYSVLSRL